MKIKNKLNILLTGTSVALTSLNYAHPGDGSDNDPNNDPNNNQNHSNLEHPYLMNVVQYLKNPEDLFKFVQVNRKCQLALKSCKTNFIPIFDQKTHNLTHNTSKLATRTKYRESYSGHAKLDQNLNLIVSTPNFEGILEGGIEVNQDLYATEFSNASIRDINNVRHNCGNVYVNIRLCTLSIGPRFKTDLRLHSNEDIACYTANKRIFIETLYAYHSDFDSYLSGEIIGTPIVRQVQKGSLIWNEITYPNAKIGNINCGKVVLNVLIEFFCSEFDPDETPKRLMHLVNANDLNAELLENINFIKEICFGFLPDDNKTTDQLTENEIQICQKIAKEKSKKYEHTNLSFYLKSNFGQPQNKNIFTPEQYKKNYNRRVENILTNIYGLDEESAKFIEYYSFQRILIIETKEGFIISTPEQNNDLLTISREDFEAHIPNMNYEIPTQYIKEQSEQSIIVSFPKERVATDTTYNSDKIFIFHNDNRNLIIPGRTTFYNPQNNNEIAIEIPKENLDSHITLYNTEGMLEKLPKKFITNTTFEGIEVAFPKEITQRTQPNSFIVQLPDTDSNLVIQSERITETSTHIVAFIPWQYRIKSDNKRFKVGIVPNPHSIRRVVVFQFN